jgi:hypothetical protein
MHLHEWQRLSLTKSRASARRAPSAVYGHFSGTRLKGWSQILATYAIIPQQDFPDTVGTEASDIALLIDTMDLPHSGRFDEFCLVSSDSAFSSLCRGTR